MNIALNRVLMTFCVIVLLSVAGIWLFWDQLPIRLVLPYVTQESVSMNGNVEKKRFSGAQSGEQTYFVYLPQGYDESGEQRYRTLYHLHGAYVRESWAGYDCEHIGVNLEKAVSASLIDPMIVVCLVDPQGDSMWSDSFDGRYQMGTALTDELIPHIDATYHTIAERNGRALQGFSMGGFGAVMNGFRVPELFSAVIVWDGALHNWETLSTKRAFIASKMFETESYFDQWSPWTYTTSGVEADLDLFILVGAMADTRDLASRFRPHLETEGLEFTYFDSDCPHNLFCMLDERGKDAFSFLADSFARH